MIKPFMVFSGELNYPQGGVRDFKGSHATLEEAIAAGQQCLRNYDFDWYHVANVESPAMVLADHRTNPA